MINFIISFFWYIIVLLSQSDILNNLNQFSYVLFVILLLFIYWIISVAIQANLSSLHFYKSGIYQDPECGDGLDHGVLVVRYGHDLFRGLDYWIIKNSWGDTWGEKRIF